MSFGHVPDWTETCPDAPRLGSWVERSGAEYLVIGCVRWVNQPDTTIVALTRKAKTDLDVLEELWLAS